MAAKTFDEAVHEYQARFPGGATRESYLGLFTYLEGLGFQVERPTHAAGTKQSDDKIVDKTTGRVYDVISDVNEGTGAGRWSWGDAGYWVNSAPSKTPPPVGSTPAPHPTQGTGPAPTTPPVPPTGTTAAPTTPAAPAAGRPAPGAWESPSRSTVVTGPGLPTNQPKPLPVTPEGRTVHRPAYDDWSSPSRQDVIIGPPVGTTRPGATPTAPATTTGAPAPGAETNPYPSAYDALARMRKRAGVGGRRSTILGGFAAGRPMTRPATILGRQAY